MCHFRISGQHSNRVCIGSASKAHNFSQGTALFCTTTFQYITLALINSKGEPYRRPIFYNAPLCITLCVVTVVGSSSFAFSSFLL
ncbi:hypothetical protein Y032_0408g926 [Ancylostoma ceylanicum]|uniref:Uncharacterized protein n=1 Tax=Ancylostoma ceylanicum TaxID=53326 RepID=A0A016X2H7_9BILA|nr:hypothetical protein Y032_0408g926 [Ancylostoma ceylanicum]